jgi:acyl-CoA hydrolase
MENFHNTGKPVSASRLTIAQLMQPEHANNLGNVHGGWIMKLVDEVGMAHLVYVASDEQGQPVEGPRLLPENEEQLRRMEEGQQRQAYRLTQYRRRESHNG